MKKGMKKKNYEKNLKGGRRLITATKYLLVFAVLCLIITAKPITVKADTTSQYTVMNGNVGTISNYYCSTSDSKNIAVPYSKKGNLSVTVTSGARWLTVTKTTDGKVCCKLSANTSSQTRYTTLKIKLGSSTATCKISQVGASVKTANNRVNTNTNKSVVMQKITSTGKVSIKNSTNWVNVEQKNGCLTIICKANSSGSKRTGKITLICGSSSWIITISQAGH